MRAAALAEQSGATSHERIGENAWRLRGATRREGIAAWCDARRIDHAWVPDGRRFSDLKLLAMAVKWHHNPVILFLAPRRKIAAVHHRWNTQIHRPHHVFHVRFDISDNHVRHLAHRVQHVVGYRLVSSAQHR